MNTVLIVSSSPGDRCGTVEVAYGGVGAPEAHSEIADLLPCGHCQPAEVACSAADARKRLDARSYDLVIIDAPLPDESGDALAVRAAENSGARVILLVGAAATEETKTRLRGCGVRIVQKPVNPTLFADALRLAEAAETDPARAKRGGGPRMDPLTELELKKIERTKGVLIRVLGMTEPQAHRFLEKQAMNLRVSRTEIAERILKTYET